MKLYILLLSFKLKSLKDSITQPNFCQNIIHFASYKYLFLSRAYLFWILIILVFCLYSEKILSEYVMVNISFESNQDFVQAAFNKVAEVIYEHGIPILECGSPAEGTEDCLDHLLTVLNDFSYDSQKVVIYLDFFTESNRVIREELDEFL